MGKRTKRGADCVAVWRFSDGSERVFNGVSAGMAARLYRMAQRDGAALGIRSAGMFTRDLWEADNAARQQRADA